MAADGIRHHVVVIHHLGVLRGGCGQHQHGECEEEESKLFHFLGLLYGCVIKTSGEYRQSWCRGL